MFYDNYVRLCNSVHKSPSAVAIEIGIAKPTVSRWKSGSTPNHATAVKVADYFGVSVSELTAEKKEKSPSITGEGNTNQSIVGPEEIKAAFWGGDKELSKEDMDAMWNDVKRFADFVAHQKKQEKKNG